MVLRAGRRARPRPRPGVVHRDVKPGNVLIREDGVTKLADLGIATASEAPASRAVGTVLGTAAYMAPEQLDGRGAGPPADVYALAAIAYEALSGRKPREGPTPLEIAHKIATDPAPDLRDAWPKAPKAAAEALKRGMALDPEDRPASAGELARELANALEEKPEETAATRRLTRRRPAAAAAPAAAGAAAAAGPELMGDRHETASREPASTAPPARVRSSGRRRPGAGAIALALIFIALAAAIIAGAALSGGDDDGSSSSADRGSAEPAKPDKAKKKEPKAKEEEKAAPAPEPEPEPAPAEEQPATGDTASGAALNEQGFALMNEGRYEEAIPVLQRAVDSFPEGTTTSTTPTRFST